MSGATVDKFQAFGQAFGELLDRKEGLGYVRRDGYTLVAEMLGTPAARPVVEAIAPGCWKAFVPGQLLHPKVQECVRGVVETQCSADGQALFEFWDDKRGGWVRFKMTSIPTVHADVATVKAAEVDIGDNENRPAVNHGSGPSPLLQQCVNRAVGSTASPQQPAQSAPAQSVPTQSAPAQATHSPAEAAPSAPVTQPAARACILPAWVVKKQAEEAAEKAAAAAAGPADQGAGDVDRGNHAEVVPEPATPPPPQQEVRSQVAGWLAAEVETAQEVTPTVKRSSNKIGAAPSPGSCKAPDTTPCPLGKVPAFPVDSHPAAPPTFRCQARGMETSANVAPEVSSAPAREVSQVHVGKLKCFYADRGFGFVHSPTLDIDAFIHASTFREQNPADCMGAELEFVLDRRSNPLRPRVLSVKVRGVAPAPVPSEVNWSRGRIRAFFPEKGFGFIATSDRQDIFVHSTSFSTSRQPQARLAGPEGSALGEEVEFIMDKRRPDRPRAEKARIVGQALPECNQSIRARLLRKVLLDVLKEGGPVQARFREDGFVLLSEVLATGPVRCALGVLSPNTPVIPEQGPVPLLITEMVLELVKTSRTPDGLECFDLLQDESGSLWIRAAFIPKPAVEPAVPAEPAARDNQGTDSTGQTNAGPRSLAPAERDREPEVTPTVAEPKEDSEADGVDWWRGGDGSQKELPVTPDLLESWPVAPMSDLSQRKSTPPQPASSEKQTCSDPWANFNDPWAQAKFISGEVDPQKDEKPLQEDLLPATSTAGRRAGAASEVQRLVASDQDYVRLLGEPRTDAVASIQQVLRLLPADAPKGVQQYLVTWARLLQELA